MHQVAKDYRSPSAAAPTKRRNVGKTDRVISATLGTMALLSLGKRRGIGRLFTATAGALLVTRAATGHSRVYDATGISSASLEEGAGVNIESSVTIRRDHEELYDFWREVGNLPTVMRHVESVEDRGGGVSHWTVLGPKDAPVEWDAKIINERPGEFVAWKSLPGSVVEHSGSVHFVDVGDHTTDVQVKLRYVPNGMEIGFALGKLAQPMVQAEVDEDLRQYKQTMEAGLPSQAESRSASSMTTTVGSAPAQPSSSAVDADEGLDAGFGHSASRGWATGVPKHFGESELPDLGVD